MSPRPAFRRLPHNAATLRASGHADDAASADAIEGFLAGKFNSLDAAVGLKPSPGQRSAQTILRRERRDRLLREAADRFFPAWPVTAQAQALARAFADYEGRAWTREKRSEACPSRHAGKVEEVAWRLLREFKKVPGERTIRRALSGRELGDIRGPADGGTMAALEREDR